MSKKQTAWRPRRPRSEARAQVTVLYHGTQKKPAGDLNHEILVGTIGILIMVCEIIPT